MRSSTFPRSALILLGVSGVLAAAAATLVQPTDVGFDTTLSSGASDNVTATASSVELTSVTATTGGYYRSTTGRFGNSLRSAQLDKDTAGAWTGTDDRFPVSFSEGFTQSGIFHPGEYRISNRHYRTGPYVDSSGPSDAVATLASGTVMTPVATPTHLRFLTGAATGTGGDAGSQDYTVTFTYDGPGSTEPEITRTVVIEDDTVAVGSRGYDIGGVEVADLNFPSVAPFTAKLDEVKIDVPTNDDDPLIDIVITYGAFLNGPMAVSHQLGQSDYDTTFDTWEGTYTTTNGGLIAQAGLPGINNGTAYW
jgi:hypothetical protein